MGLPFVPESLAVMRDRYRRAVEKVWILPDNFQGTMKERPGLHRDHLFDFEDGLRLLISNDKLFEEDEPVIHISASYEGRPNGITSLQELEDLVVTRWRSISGCGLRYHIHLIGVSPKHVPHWFVCGGNNAPEHGRAN